MGMLFLTSAAKKKFVVDVTLLVASTYLRGLSSMEQMIQTYEEGIDGCPSDGAVV
jgi:hypothetical protein